MNAAPVVKKRGRPKKNTGTKQPKIQSEAWGNGKENVSGNRGLHAFRALSPNANRMNQKAGLNSQNIINQQQQIFPMQQPSNQHIPLQQQQHQLQQMSIQQKQQQPLYRQEQRNTYPNQQASIQQNSIEILQQSNKPIIKKRGRPKKIQNENVFSDYSLNNNNLSSKNSNPNYLSTVSKTVDHNFASNFVPNHQLPSQISSSTTQLSGYASPQVSNNGNQNGCHGFNKVDFNNNSTLHNYNNNINSLYNNNPQLLNKKPMSQPLQEPFFSPNSNNVNRDGIIIGSNQNYNNTNNIQNTNNFYKDGSVNNPNILMNNINSFVPSQNNFPHQEINNSKNSFINNNNNINIQPLNNNIPHNVLINSNNYLNRQNIPDRVIPINPNVTRLDAPMNAPITNPPILNYIPNPSKNPNLTNHRSINNTSGTFNLAPQQLYPPINNTIVSNNLRQINHNSHIQSSIPSNNQQPQNFPISWSNSLVAPNDEDDDDYSESDTDSEYDDVVLMHRNFVEEDTAGNVSGSLVDASCSFSSNVEGAGSNGLTNENGDMIKPKRKYKKKVNDAFDDGVVKTKRKYTKRVNYSVEVLDTSEQDYLPSRKQTPKKTYTKAQKGYEDDGDGLEKKRKKYKKRERYHMVDGVMVKKQWGRPAKKKNGDDANEELKSGINNSDEFLDAARKIRPKRVEQDIINEKRSLLSSEWQEGRKKAFEELLGLGKSCENDGPVGNEICEKEDVSKNVVCEDDSSVLLNDTTKQSVPSINDIETNISKDSLDDFQDTRKEREKVFPMKGEEDKFELKKEKMIDSNIIASKENIYSDNVPTNTTTDNEDVDEKDLLRIQERLANLTEPELLRKVIGIIDVSGSYNLEASSLDIDLYTLSASTVKKLMDTLGLI